ncbi:serine/threonine-protein kinase Nek4-like [Biomphalaria glabrata]|uniref:non-specific serine/threonine protein kinase n=1 Tax=Biomphalaria glabrata TaxID=6526 RepID=A0A9W2ZE70_BIOGL|nr:serine/threonine-protein kinase Nek4-like [Biomphalaria glabrata]XP_055873215.1 serine/threonine-protein kinase Nek4-like [Biomphalaria glabrata]
MSLKILRKLGEGGFGKVYLFQNTDEYKYALKVVSLKGYYDIEQAKEEGRIMMKLCHPHINQCVFVEPIGTSNLCMALEYCINGTLARKIKLSRIEEPLAVMWFTQMADAIQYLHEQHIIHRDIKPENILLTSRDQIMVGDLGVARKLKDTLQSARTCIGTPCYMSPQIQKGQQYTSKTDVWSLGCVFHEVLSRRAPFNYTMHMPIVEGTTPPLPDNYSDALRNFIFRVLTREEIGRPSASEVFIFCKLLLPGEYQRIKRRRLEPIHLDKQEIRKALRIYDGTVLSEDYLDSEKSISFSESSEKSKSFNESSTKSKRFNESFVDTNSFSKSFSQSVSLKPDK